MASAYGPLLHDRPLFHWGCCSVSGVHLSLCPKGFLTLCRGWDQTGTNGANLDFPEAFGIPEHNNPNAARNQWIVGVVNAFVTPPPSFHKSLFDKQPKINILNSAPYLASAVLGCWLSDPLNNWFGRRGCIFGSAVFCTIAPIGSALSQNWQQLFVTRVLLGLGMGMKASTIPIFSAENTPASVRGGLVMSWQLYGILLHTPSSFQRSSYHNY